MPNKVPPAELAADVRSIQQQENMRLKFFEQKSDEELIEQTVGIFRSATEGIPTHNPQADEALKTLLSSLLTGNAPEAPYFASFGTQTAWNMLTQVLIQRIASVHPVDLRRIPDHYTEQVDTVILKGVDLEGMGMSTEEYWTEFRDAFESQSAQQPPEAISG